SMPFVLHVRVGSLLGQQSGKIGMAVRGRPKKRRVLEVILGVDVRALLDQQSDDVGMIMRGSSMQRRPLHVVARVDVGSGVDSVAGCSKVASLRSSKKFFRGFFR